DGDANLIVGKYGVLVKGGGSLGLPFLAGGSVSAVKALAEKDLAQPASADDQLAEGPDWQEGAEYEDGTGRPELYKRRHWWYLKAVPLLEGKEETELEKRIELLNKRAPGLVKPWDRLDISEAKTQETSLRLDLDKGIVTKKAWSGPISITAIVLGEKDVRL